MSCRLLIVDDERDFAATLAERLKLRAYDAHVVQSFQDTVALVESLRPEIVLLDLNLPGISGIEILMTIKNLYPGVEVILLTGHMDLTRTIEGLRLDSFHYIFKPFDIRELVAKVEAVRKKND